MSEVDHSQRAHSRIGASSTKRWFNCPASVPLSKGIENKSSKYAEEGTAAHELAEYLLQEDLEGPHGFGLEFNGFKVDMDMIDHVNVYLAEVRGRITDNCEVLIEEKFHLDWIHPDLFGSNDACIIDHVNHKVTVLDYKHGQGIAVEAEENEQLMYYALGATRNVDPFYEVELVIVQPRCDHPEGPVRYWVTDMDRLAEFEKELKRKVADVEACEKEEKPYGKPGDWCRFCPANGTCEAFRNKSHEVAMVEFNDEDIAPIAPEQLNSEQIGKVLTNAKVLEAWLKSVKDYAKTLADNGTEIPGMKLVKARSIRKWKDESAVVEEFSPLFGDDLYTKKLRSPAQLEKIIGKESVDKLTEKPDKGNTLVVDTDKRAAVLPTAIEDFTDI